MVDERVTDAMVEQMSNYAVHYGGSCRDCADADGVCRDGQPCSYAMRVAVTRHTVKALMYGIQNGFVPNPFTAALADTGKAETLPVVEYSHEDRVTLAGCLSWDLCEISPLDVNGILDRLDAEGYQLIRSALVQPAPADTAVVEKLTRPIAGIENRTAQEAFDIMADRIRLALSTPTSHRGADGSAPTTIGGVRPR